MSSDSIRFFKFQGLANDFLILDAEHLSASRFFEDPARHVREMCHRLQGIGADGVIVAEKLDGARADLRMHLWNADGSRAEMSGNGLRCLAAHWQQNTPFDGEELRILTDAGIKKARFLGFERTGRTIDWRIALEIGEPIFDPARIPFLPDPGSSVPLIEHPLYVGHDDVPFHVTVTSMGNPHCSLFSAGLILTPEFITGVGGMIERHSNFPNRTNVEFVEVINRHRIRVRFWERGVGNTKSSGTGSCAAAVASILRGLTERRVTVETEAGDLTVEWDEATNQITLTGIAGEVFTGEYTL
jgi:diaminopimelate epimerase